MLRVAGMSAPLAIVDDTRPSLARAVLELLCNEHLDEPARDDTGRPLRSLLALLRPDASAALGALDDAAAGSIGWTALPLRLYRTVATLRAMGCTVTRRDARAEWT